MIRRTLEMCRADRPLSRSFMGFSSMYLTSMRPLEMEDRETEPYFSFRATSYSDQMEELRLYTLGAPGRSKCIPTRHTEDMAATHCCNDTPAGTRE